MKANSSQKAQMEMLADPVSIRDHIQGPFDAPVTLLEYGDYECPVCATVSPAIKAIQKILGDQLRFVFRNFPLPNAHPHAERAAQAAESAGAQGCFWEMHDLLFQNQHALSEEALIQYATDLGLDIPRFISELVLGVYGLRFREDFRSGVRSGVEGTPSFFIDGRRYGGARNFEMLLAALSEIVEA